MTHKLSPVANLIRQVSKSINDWNIYLAKYVHEPAKGKKPALMYWITPEGKKFLITGQ